MSHAEPALSEEETPGTSKVQLKKEPKRGIIYLSSIPPYMNVTQIREYFGQFGTLGRVYLQLADTTDPKKKKAKSDVKKSKRKVAKKFTEGWVEFERKSVAKKAAQLLNNTQVSSRKKSKHFDVIWNIKYLSHFKWTHLHERLAYEKAARRQKLRAEIQLAKKKANFFTSNLNKTKKDTIANKEFQSNNVLEEKDDSTPTANDDREDFLKTLYS